MTTAAALLFLALVSQARSPTAEEQEEFEATLATEEGYQHAHEYVRQNSFLLPFELKQLAAAATQSEVEDVPFRALQILRLIGPDAADHEDIVYPFLIHEDRLLRLAAVECLAAMHPGRFFPEIAHMAVFDEDSFVHWSATSALVASESLEAVPFILAIYLDDDPQRAASAIRGTASCSPELQSALIPGLIQVLRRQDSAYESLSKDTAISKPLREDAIDVLGNLGEMAVPYLPEIKRMQTLEEDAAMQIRYAVAIINIGGIDEKQVRRVREFMEDGPDHLRHRSCEACVDSPLLADALRDSLVALAEHEDADVRRQVAFTFRFLELSGPDVIGALNTLSRDYADTSLGAVCWEALHALADRDELHDPLDRSLVAMRETEFGEFEAYWVVERALGKQAALAAIVEDFAAADEFRRSELMELLFWGPNRCIADTYRQLLQLPLSDAEHERLTNDLENCLQDDAPREPITDWRLPTEESATCGY